SAISGWSGDGTIAGASGTITLAALSEDSTIGTTVVTLTAASDGTAITGYTVTGTPSVVTLATPTVGTVTLSATVDYEVDDVLVLKIEATDGTVTGTATVSVLIGDVGPFTTITKELCVEDGLGPDTNFAVSPTSGAVTTAAGVTLDKATKDEYTVAISGTVTGGESNVLTLTVKVGDCSGKEKMAAALGSLLLSLLAYALLSL
ncbi:hypothetical protein MAR_036015, partial [Mya arenaria]